VHYLAIDKNVKSAKTRQWAAISTNTRLSYISIPRLQSRGNCITQAAAAAGESRWIAMRCNPSAISATAAAGWSVIAG